MAIARRIEMEFADLFSLVLNEQPATKMVAATDLKAGPVAQVVAADVNEQLEPTLVNLGGAAAKVLTQLDDREQLKTQLREFCRNYVDTLRTVSVPFAKILHRNIRKVRGRFIDPERSNLPTFDEKSPQDEQLPWEFEIVVQSRATGLCQLSWNGVFIGDPLSDNIEDRDDYRFHDVFHLAHAAILHWSPTFRSLTKRKRKSDRRKDEEEDGGRAIVVEEGLTAWIFSRAKHIDLFENKKRISFDLLKTIEQFVKGYEVDAVPLRMWEIAILEGYKVFRQVKDHKGGRIIGNRRQRTLIYEPIRKEL
jgi:hypothetical protein